MPTPRRGRTGHPLYFLESLRFDLPYPLPGDAKPEGQFVECQRLILESATGEDVAFALIQNCQPEVQRPSAGLQLLTFGKTGFLIGTFVYQPVLPFD